jgi:hypothetical protein
MADVEGYSVSTADLRAHAGRVRGVSDVVGAALTAAKSVSPPAGTFSEAAAQFSRLLASATDDGFHTFDAAVKALDASAKLLTDTASVYDQRESDTTNNLKAAGDRQ